MCVCNDDKEEVLNILEILDSVFQIMLEIKELKLISDTNKSCYFLISLESCIKLFEVSVIERQHLDFQRGESANGTQRRN